MPHALRSNIYIAINVSSFGSHTLLHYSLDHTGISCNYFSYRAIMLNTGSGTWTHTGVYPTDFESVSSANSNIPACFSYCICISEPIVGFEPTTYWLQVSRSAVKSYIGMLIIMMCCYAKGSKGTQYIVKLAFTECCVVLLKSQSLSLLQPYIVTHYLEVVEHHSARLSFTFQ